MKKIVLSAFLVITCAWLCPASSQILNKVKNKVKQRADQKVDQTIDKSLDKVEQGVEGTGKTTEGSNGSEVATKNTETTTSEKSAPKGLKSYSRYDFVPGDRIIYAEDFSQDVIGEFPLKWNTDGSGEIVTVDGTQGKWMRVFEKTNYETPFKGPLPENFTIEFDFLSEYKDDQRVPELSIKLEADAYEGYHTKGGFQLYLSPNGGSSVTRDLVWVESKTQNGRTHLDGKRTYINTFEGSNHKVTPVHIAIWVQKQRLRVWVNQEKMYDLPKGISEDVYQKLKYLGFEVEPYGGAQDNYQFYITNIKIAAATPDNRSKLITEGKWSTTGILFDVNSDKIKPISYGTLKEIAGVLTENADVKVKIIGHTDSDGDDNSNLELSKKRAAAVKKALADEFGIDASRMETEGQGETKPVGDNKTVEGKAQNRRVEFIKQ